MKRILQLVMVVVLGLFVLSGCVAKQSARIDMPNSSVKTDPMVGEVVDFDVEKTLSLFTLPEKSKQDIRGHFPKRGWLVYDKTDFFVSGVYTERGTPLKITRYTLLKADKMNYRSIEVSYTEGGEIYDASFFFNPSEGSSIKGYGLSSLFKKKE